MRFKNLLFLFMLISFSALNAQNNSGTDHVINLGRNGESTVYYKLQNDQVHTVEPLNWHIAFQIDNMQGIGVHANSRYGSYWWVKTSFTNLDEVTPDNFNSYFQSEEYEVYNSLVTWNIGAFNNDHWDDQTNPSPYYIGWGTYNPSTHIVSGDKVFIGKLYHGPTSRIFKFKINSRFKNYDFSISELIDGNWSTPINRIINDDDYNSQGRKFAYYNIATNQMVEMEPENNSDLIFGMYTQNLNKEQGWGGMYLVTGVLQQRGITVAEKTEGDEIDSNFEGLEYHSDLNIIGRDWKQFNGQGNDIFQDKKYYIKTREGEYYRIYFKNYEFTSDYERLITFNKQKVIATNIPNVHKNEINIFPNTIKNYRFTIANLPENVKGKIRIYNMNGQLVFDQINENKQTTIQVSLPKTLPAGTYILIYQYNEKRYSSNIIIQ